MLLLGDFVLKTIETIETIFYFKKKIGISQKQKKGQKPCAFVLKTIETIETIFYFKKNIDISQKQVQAKKKLSLLSLLSLK